MRKIFITAIVFLSFFQVHASNNEGGLNKNVFWKCKTEFQANARGFTALGMGTYKLDGHGVMSCYAVNLTKAVKNEEKRDIIDVTNQAELDALNSHLDSLVNSSVLIRMPVKMTFQSSPFQLSATLGRVKVAGYSHGYTLTKDINQLIGSYKIAAMSGSFGLGFGGFVAGRVDRQNLSFNMSLQVLQGFGGSFGFSKLLIEIAEAS